MLNDAEYQFWRMWCSAIITQHGAKLQALNVTQASSSSWQQNSLRIIALQRLMQCHAAEYVYQKGDLLQQEDYLLNTKVESITTTFTSFAIQMARSFEPIDGRKIFGFRRHQKYVYDVS